MRGTTFRKEEFVDFLGKAHRKFGKILMILDGAPQHRANDVKAELENLAGPELAFLPPGCPDLSAIEEEEEVWQRLVAPAGHIPAGDRLPVREHPGVTGICDGS